MKWEALVELISMTMHQNQRFSTYRGSWRIFKVNMNNKTYNWKEQYQKGKLLKDPLKIVKVSSGYSDKNIQTYKQNMKILSRKVSSEMGLWDSNWKLSLKS